MDIVRKALRIPCFTIASNAGQDAQEIVTNVMRESGNYGYDAMNGEFVDMLQAGIIDPTKVRKEGELVRLFLKNKSGNFCQSFSVCYIFLH